ncbi:GNAT family N-acetyltransferase [bacterium]|nr:GNAT family N-acetyltransferase [bacterium]
MIQRLDHKKTTIAENIYTVFQKSYAVEAKLLEAVDFPPLKRKPSSFKESENIFFGFYMDEYLAAVIELASPNNTIHVQSLVVLPQYFRLGIASSLLSFVLVSYPSKLFSVETGLKNIPAIELYKKFDFIETKQWDTDHGVRKVRFEKNL